MLNCKHHGEETRLLTARDCVSVSQVAFSEGLAYTEAKDRVYDHWIETCLEVGYNLC